MRLAAPLLPELACAPARPWRWRCGATAAPTIVLLEESPSPVHVDMRHGTVFSLLGTASGRLFAAHLSADVVRPIYDAERRAAPALRGEGDARDARTGRTGGDPRAAWPTWAQFQRELDDVRRHGLGRAEGAVMAGVSALSAPVFDHRGAMVLAITAIGPSAALDTRWSGPVAATLRDAARSVSARLGHAAAASGDVR